MTEYVVVTIAMVAALLVPWGSENRSTLERLLDAGRTFHQNSSRPLSLP